MHLWGAKHKLYVASKGCTRSCSMCALVMSTSEKTFLKERVGAQGSDGWDGDRDCHS